MSVEPNLIAGGKDMKMNQGHHRHYLCQQKSLPNGSTERIDPSMYEEFSKRGNDIFVVELYRKVWMRIHKNIWRKVDWLN